MFLIQLQHRKGSWLIFKMADEEQVLSSSSNVLEDLHNLVWGPNVKEEVFQRWTQGTDFILLYILVKMKEKM
jgi:hypothetical protein